MSASSSIVMEYSLEYDSNTSRIISDQILKSVGEIIIFLHSNYYHLTHRPTRSIPIFTLI